MEKLMAKKKIVQKVEEQAIPVAPITPPEPVQLSIADLQILARIVDLASRRGAFQASELAQIGESYNKLSGFLAYIESTSKPDEENKDETLNDSL